MNFVNRARAASVALAALAAVAFAVPASAQEISESHLKAARAAISALHATDQFDAILPQAAAALKAELIQKNPDLQEVILNPVDERTLAIASRRADLENEVANAYARIFSEEDLKGIADFYNSAPGKKLLSDGPIVTREVVQAAEIWQRGVARDLAQNVGEVLDKKMPKPEASTVNAPVTPTAPVPAPANGGDATKDAPPKDSSAD
jgi:hypothetical protein